LTEGRPLVGAPGRGRNAVDTADERVAGSAKAKLAKRVDRPRGRQLLADWPPATLKEAGAARNLLDASEVANVAIVMLTRPRA